MELILSPTRIIFTKMKQALKIYVNTSTYGFHTMRLIQEKFFSPSIADSGQVRADNSILCTGAKGFGVVV